MPELKHNCPYNNGVTCGWKECERCGWNPEVEAYRKAKARLGLMESTPQRERRPLWYIGSGAFPKR